MTPLGTAIVTGAASGIGFATTVRLAAEGWDLALVDLDPAGLERAVAVAKDAGRRAHPFPLDLTAPSGFGEVVAAAADWNGTVRLLVNDAGIGVAATVPETDDATWDRILAVNLTAMFHTCRAVLPAMIEAGAGIIVNVSSVAGVVGVRNRAAYCASKAGVLGLTRAIAVDHGHQGIRANAICPGTVATEWIGKILADSPDPGATRAAMEARQLDGRMGRPEEVAAGIAFLASDDGRFMNGAAFVMDGGMTAI
ncbi:MAG: 2-keto-3-deoxy-L-fuconate dehydrogenase [Acidimicrobiaceae bacterium]|jgi:NAD(P)-dependent dehydrogenase (short-subunit alcohol dehydrogenase family)|nr:2-keto-3-deoxy-L-fuconate dehydrogenase [Acidimicrobiaceae bacterium]